MRSLAAALVIVLVTGSTAWAGNRYVVAMPVYPAPVPVVSYYMPPAPVYVAPAPVVPYAAYYAPAVSYYAPAVAAYPAPVYAYPAYPVPVVVRARVYPYGQPVRNVVRVVLP